MTASRRDFLKLAGLVAGSAALSSCAPAYAYLARLGKPDPFSAASGALSQKEWLLLGRLSFGPAPAEGLRVAEIGLSAWIEEQLTPDTIDDFACDLRLREFRTLDLSAQDLFDLSDKRLLTVVLASRELVVAKRNIGTNEHVIRDSQTVP